MPISNYQNPGVYVTQVTNPSLASVNNNALNICFLAAVPSGVALPVAPQTDRFLLTSTSGIQTFSVTQSGAFYSSFALTNNVTGATLVSGVDYTPTVTNGTITSFTTISGGNGISGVNGVGANGYIQANYNYGVTNSGQLYTFYDFNSVQNLFGPAFNFNSTTGAVTVNSPASLAAYLAFQNGAQTVTCSNIAISGATTVSGVNTKSATAQDYLNAVYGLVLAPSIDVIVPLYFDSSFVSTTSGTLFTGLSNFLNAQATNGIYQRAFIGLDPTTVSGTNLVNTVANITTGLKSKRVTLAVPQQITVNPGLNSTTGISTGSTNVEGFYLAAALAGLFVGQDDVYVPITHKVINGLIGIPNQISTSQSTTIQSLGGTVARQRADGTIYVRHGLTTDTSNWLTQEISINAIGDRLAQYIQGNIENSEIIGSPLTQGTLASLQSIVLSTLMRAVTNNLIQSYQNLTYSVNVSNPTTVNVSFQYSPTFPLNYVQVTMSINSQTGSITSASNISSTAIA